MKSFQDYYADDLAWCFGCGRLNLEGHHLQSFWEGETTVARFTPKAFHTAVPGFVSGGVLASIIDCHATGSASAAAHRAAGRELGDGPLPRFVTASLRVDYRHPTPLGPELVLRGRPEIASLRKVSVAVDVRVGERATVQGEAVCVALPDAMRPT